MRVRMIRPAYWTDADLHTRLTAEVREFYIGLWMLADDAGYIDWDLTRVGAELYPFRPQSWRLRKLPAMLELLGSAHAQLLECGAHVLVPNLAKNNHVPRPSFQNQRAHDACIRHVVPRATSGGQVVPRGTTTEEKGKEGKKSELNGTARGNEETMKDRVAAHGYKPS